jgi:hypothetical protein
LKKKVAKEEIRKIGERERYIRTRQIVGKNGEKAQILLR